MSKISVLITCYNRIETTIKTLNNLYLQNYNFDVFLLDDNSTDNTSEIVRQYFPSIKIYVGDGNYFWSRGMLFLWEKAIEKDYDFYLWLNNDVYLYDNALTELMQISKKYSDSVIVSGILLDPILKKVSYGGYNDKKQLIVPNGQIQLVKYLNGNFVLIPKNIVKQIGLIDPVFHHDLGDVEYGFRVLKKGFKILSTRIIVGECITNNPNRLRSINKNMFERFKILFSPLGSPLKQQFYFNRKYYGLLYSIMYILYIIIINIFPDSLYNIVQSLRKFKK